VKSFFSFICASGLIAITACAQSSIELTVINSPGRVIPDDFTGLSFESGHQLPNVNGVRGNLFSPTNTELVTLFRNLNFRNLRIGGGTIDGLKAAKLSHADVDNLFGFAQAAELKVIFSLQLLNGDTNQASAMAQYVWQKHRPFLDWLAIGNEPDEPPYRYPPFGKGTDPNITNYTSYLAPWRKFASAVTNTIPGVTFAAPDTGGATWNTNFANDEGNSGLIALFTTHDYFGGKWQGQTSDTAVSNMLSPRWVNVLYPREFNAQSVVMSNGFSYRLTEINDYLGGVTNASNAFASALWALDVLHWWAAAPGCAGINFHNNEWLLTDTIFLNRGNRSFQVNPKAYGIKAFDLGGHGRVMPTTLSNPDNRNLTAYGVADATNLYVTLINKEFGANGRDATVTLSLTGFSSGPVEAMYLTAAGGDVESTNGVTLGGAFITNNAPWQGKWTPLNPVTNHLFTVTVPAATASVLKLAVIPNMRVPAHTH
jgi:hypothetical protein